MTKRRRKVDPTERLSEQMIEVLLWVYENQPEYSPQGFVRWRPSVFIGENPTPSKSNALSTSLKRLEERGLLIRYSGTFKDGYLTRLVWAQVAKGRIRTSHVQLTRAGFRFVELLVNKDFDPKDEANQAQRKAQRQAEGLRLALGLITERIEQGMDDEAERAARRARLAVAESLNQLVAKNRGES